MIYYRSRNAQGQLGTATALPSHGDDVANPTTIIRFDLPEANAVDLTIFNSVGEKVRSLVHEQRIGGSYVEV